MAKEVSLEQLKAEIGGEERISSWLMIDQDRINRFADVTGDHQFIHLDEARAAEETPFGGTIAHGFLSLSLLVTLSHDVALNLKGTRMAINYGFEKIRFLNPVRSGKRVRAHFKTVEVYEKSPGNVLIKTGVSLEIEGEERPALVAEWLGLTVLENQELDT